MAHERNSGAGIADRTLATACARALVAGARGAGTRQQVRAAARRFVRRHRRDAGYLAWVLRSVAASSALAVALLGLAAAPAGAALPPFQSSGLLGLDVGTESAASLGDLDGDGDLDLVAGNDFGTFDYFANTGNATIPAFATAANPLTGQSVGSNSIPSLGDLDGDGDLDLVAGEHFGTFFYFENTGSATSAAFAARTGSANPLNGQDIGLYSTPSLGDLDADGDLDLVAGEGYYGSLVYFENTGSATSPAFVRRTGSANPLAGQNIGVAASASLGDLDRDGDLDVVAGENFGTFSALENTGSASSPAFVLRTGAANPLAGVDIGYHTQVALGDLDGNGDADLVAGEFDGVFNYYRNRAGGIVERTGAANPLNGQLVGGDSTPSLGDLDGDGDLDLVAGDRYAFFYYYENTGSKARPAFVQRTGAANPLNGQDVGNHSAPALADLDGDGDLDLVAGEYDGVFDYFENTGSAVNPAFVQRTGSANPLAGLPVIGLRSTPSLGDLDDDGDVDLVASNQFAGLRYFENTGSAANPAFIERTGTANPLGGQFPAGPPSLGDLDSDGDLDVIAGGQPGTFSYFENTGNAANPVFAARTSEANPLAGQDVGFYSKPVLGDLDGDGDLDVLAGEYDGVFNYYESLVVQSPLALALPGAASPLAGQDVGSLSAPALADLDRDGDADLLAGEDLGTFRFFENTGSAIAPAFVARTGAANPLNGRDVGDEAKPAFADLDGDGDFDLLAGRLAGDFDYFENTGDATTPLFAAPVANPFGLAGVGSGSSPAFGDLDGDGDLDLAVGEYYDTLVYFENVGSRTSPAFAERFGFANPLDTLDVGYTATPALADVDGDGDLDLFSGATGGRIRYFQNEGSAIDPVFVRLIGPGNPLDNEDVGNRSAPAAADLDGDGDSDLVTGALSGTFAIHYFPEPARGLLLGAGIALLKALGRGRRERA